MEDVTRILVYMLLIGISAALHNDSVSGQLYIRPYSNLNARTPFKCGTKVGPVCADDCRTFLACTGSDEPTGQWFCADYTSKNTPYCVNKVCTAEANTNDAHCVPDTSFQCTGEGLFPDPSDCTTYYYCDGVAKPAVMYRCPQDYVFFSETKLCRRKANNGQCQTMNCINRKNKFAAFDFNKAYYAFCSDTITYMFKCEDDENYLFDDKTNECKFYCKKAGDFVDRLDCTKYIACDRTNGNAKSIECPKGYYFNKERCVHGTCTPEISTTSTVTPAPTPSL